MRYATTLFAVVFLTRFAHAEPISVTERTTIIEKLVNHLHTSYIDAEQAGKLEPVLSHADFRQAAGEEAFAKAATALMQSVTKDQHLRLLYSANPGPEQQRSSPASASMNERQARLRAQNDGIERVERLPGNVGNLKTNFFAPAAEAAPPLPRR